MSDQPIGRTIRAAIWGVVLGGVAGFTLGMLTAPEEGRRMRRRLAYQLDVLGNRVSKAVDEFTETVEAGAARLEGDALVADAKDRAQQIRADIDALIGEMRDHRKAG